MFAGSSFVVFDKFFKNLPEQCRVLRVSQTGCFGHCPRRRAAQIGYEQMICLSIEWNQRIVENWSWIS